MIAAVLSVLVVFIILLVSEWLWRTKRLRGEFGRKLVHISVGSFVAFWPFYMSFHYIQLISLAFLLVVLISSKLHLFHAVYKIDRKSWGNILFAVGIGLTALLTSSHWIFMAAILHLSLADGLAAVIGKHFGQARQYKVFTATKSVVGTATFWLVSALILLYVLTQGATSQTLTLPLLIWLPVASAVIENLGIYGLDNVLVPLFIVLTLSQLKFIS